MARIVLHTFGSFGDLHPYLALALGLKARGHQPVLATIEYYRPKVEGEGIEFAPVGPHLEPKGELINRIMHPTRGTEVLFGEVLVPALEACHEESMAALRGADLLVSHPLSLATVPAAVRLGVPWISSVLSPVSMFSCHDHSVYPRMEWLGRARWTGPWFYRLLQALGRLALGPMERPIRALWRAHGLTPPAHPILHDQHSPAGVLALFSRALAAPEVDWPPKTTLTGFCFYDKIAPGAAIDPVLERFVGEGEPPLVYTLGSAAVLNPGDFFEQAAQATEILGRRAVLLTGPDMQAVPARLPTGVRAFPYAPFSALFPRAAAVIHQCGVGTTGQVLRAGVPSLAVPLSHDQFDNAARLERAGVARWLSRKYFTARRVARELEALLGDEAVRQRAAAAARVVAGEDGVATAVAAIEEHLARRA